jgi:sensor domain CHASE-containing protein
MAKTRILLGAVLLIAVLSMTFNVYQWNLNSILTTQNNDLVAKQEMTALLTQVQLGVNGELEQLDSGLQAASQQLSTVDLKGTQARGILEALVASNPLILNAAIHVNDFLVTVEPDEYRYIEGQNVGNQTQNIQARETLRPAMSEEIPLVEGTYGAVMVTPVFSGEGKYYGALSLVFEPSALVNRTVTAALNSSAYTFMALQTDGRVLYDVDRAQIGAMTLSDPAFQDYPQLLAVCQRMATEKSGYDTYQFNVSLGSSEVVKKECFWTTSGIYGAEWRLAIIHRLN